MRGRLLEHFKLIVTEDCLTLFNRIVDFSRIECSIVLPNASQLPPESKYKAAAVLTVLTGQLPHGDKCKIEWEDPMYLRLTKAEIALENQSRSAALARQHSASLKGNKNNNKQTPKLTSEDFKDAAGGFKLTSNMGRVRMWDFLEKLREFCLPDVTALNDASEKIERGHDNSRPDYEIRRQFQKNSLSKQPIFCPRIAIGLNDNPKEASTAYILKAHDLLKFPDIEVHFEALGSVLSSEGIEKINPNSIKIILRPHLRVFQPSIDKLNGSLLPHVDNLRIMNWLLAQFFNEYLARPLFAIQ